MEPFRYQIPKGKYLHYKGNEYEVLGVARHSETLEEMVVYRALYGDRDLWVRPASMWNETIEKNGVSFLRFAKVEDEMRRETAGIRIEPLAEPLSVCKVEDYSGIDMDQPFCFPQRTDEECSLVCPTKLVPANATDREDGWRAMRICGQLEFSLIGILAGIAGVLAERGISIFAISTFNTDYVLVKGDCFAAAIRALGEAGYDCLSQASGMQE